jgi:hypothetical protein
MHERKNDPHIGKATTENNRREQPGIRIGIDFSERVLEIFSASFVESAQNFRICLKRKLLANL